MRRWMPRIFITLALAAAVHFIFVMAIPYVISSALERGILESAELNSFRHDNPRSHGPENKIPQSNPDFLPSILVYDLSDTPLRIHLAVPGNVPYWSFSLFASNIDNYYVLNDRDEKVDGLVDGVKEVDLVLVGPETSYQASGEELVVESPSDKGFGLIRMIIEDRYSERGLKRVDELRSVQKLSFAEQVKRGVRP